MWLFLLTLSHVSAQQVIVRPGIQLITLSDGYPFTTATSLLQDRNGFLWIGAVDGLSRYDGYSFRLISEELSLNPRSILSMEEDDTGYLWLGHFAGKVTRLNRSTMKAETFVCSAKKESDVIDLHCDDKGTVWASVRNEGLFVFEGNQFKRVSWSGNEEARTNVSSMVDDADTLWMGDADGVRSLHIPSKKVLTATRLSGEDGFDIPIRSLIKIKDMIWIGTYGYGLIRFDSRSKEWMQFRYQDGSPGTTNIINAVARKSDDELWIATNGKGIGSFSLSKESFQFYHEPEPFDSGPLCNQIIQDRSGIVWSTSDRGLFKWNVQAESFSFSKLIPVKSDNGSYYGIGDVLETTTPRRTILGTMFTFGLVVKDDSKTQVIPFDILPQTEPFKIVNDLHEDADGNVWVITRDFLYQLTRNNALIKEDGLSRSLPSGVLPYFVRMVENKQGDLFIASSRNGVFIRDNSSNRWSRLTEEQGSLLSNRATRAVADNEGSIWFLHPLAGITRYDCSTKKSQFFSANDQPFLSSRLIDLTLSHDNKIWIASIDGLGILDPKSGLISSVDAGGEMPSSYINSLCADDQGNMWVAGSRGVSVLTKTGMWRHFNHLAGLTGIPSSFSIRRGKAGMMHIVTYQGYYSFDPVKVLNQSQSRGRVVISQVKNEGEQVWNYASDSPLQIDYDNNDLTIDFSSLNFDNPQRNSYEFIMEGLHDQWTNTALHSVNFSGLPSGDFVFRVKLTGQKDSEAAALRIEVSTPFWQSWWFIGAMGGVIAGMLYFLYHFRMSNIRREEQAKSQLQQKLAEVEMKALRAQMSPHFIFNSLNSINRYIVKSDPETASGYLTKFSKLMRLILENSNNKVITLEQELAALKLYIELEGMRFNHKFSYSISVDPSVDVTTIGVPPMVIQPFIENAIWHGLLHKESPGTLSIAIRREDENVQCIIEDNGVGRRRAKELKSKSINSERSFGMKITSDRLSMAMGNSSMSTVEIEDLVDDQGNALGTRVKLLIAAIALEPEF